MKNMKKTLAVVLTVLMVIASASMIFAYADESENVNQTANADPYKLKVLSNGTATYDDSTNTYNIAVHTVAQGSFNEGQGNKYYAGYTVNVAGYGENATVSFDKPGGITTVWKLADEEKDGFINNGVHQQWTSVGTERAYRYDIDGDGATDFTVFNDASAAKVEAANEEQLAKVLNLGNSAILTADIGLTTNRGLTVAKGAEVILDLNGHKIVSNAPDASASAVITNYGNLTIMDSVGGGKITMAALNPDDSAIPGYASNTISNNGTLTLESGIIENATNAGAAYCVDNYQGATFTMNGGELTATRCALRMFCNSETLTINVTINDGAIKCGSRAIWVQLPGSNSEKAAAGNLTINGGIIDGGEGQSLYVYTFGNNHTATFITITGGTFENDVLFGGGTYKGTKENVSITGGTFKGWLGRYLADNGWENITGDECYHLVDNVISKHEFADATCTAPKNCACGETEGDALGHVDDNADNACDRCGFVLKVEEEKDDAPTSIVDTIRNNVESVIKKATETATEVVENVVNSVRETAERISNAAETAVKNVTETFEAIQANVTEFFDGLKARLEEIFSF